MINRVLRRASASRRFWARRRAGRRSEQCPMFCAPSALRRPRGSDPRGACFPEDQPMSDLVIRPLVAGEENLFESMPDPLPQLRQVGYADGIAGGGYRPENTWVALRAGRVVGRAAWVLPPGAVGAPWLERFDLDAEPEVGAALLCDAHEVFGGPRLYYAAMPAHWRRRPEVLSVIKAPMAAARPDVLTGLEMARAVGGVDLATDPLAWLTGPAGDWRIALDSGEPVGLAATA